MHTREIERYVGIPYCAQSMDCADLVVLVQRALFGREVRLPNGRPRGPRGQAVLGDLSRSYGTPTDAPADGDLVLMQDRGRAGHVGVYFHLAGEGWVLHTSQVTGSSVLHRARDLPDWGAPIVEIYRWA